MNNTFFASCNSYFGFHSYFDQIFNSKKFDKVFVLKGAPGTGKSTFMKNVASSFAEKTDKTEFFRCSSDVKSLDGILLEKGSKRITIIDGTAPHRQDAVIVGAVDEIINLGDGLNCEWLEPQKEKIISLIEEKQRAYNTAYSYLNIAGFCYKEISKYYENSFDYNEAYKRIHLLGFDTVVTGKTKRIRLISSFSKDGYQKIEFYKGQNSDRIRIGGNQYCARLFLTILKNHVGEGSTVFPYPLFPDVNEGVHSSVSKTTYVSCENDKYDLDANEFYKRDLLCEEMIKTASNIHDDALKESQRWLNIASNIHFRLEDIYSHCMNFDETELQLSQVCNKINKVFDIQL